MHIHEINPWRTLIALSVFVLVIIVGFLTMSKPLLTYKLDIKQSVAELEKTDGLFYPWQLDSFLTNKMQKVVLFDIRDNFVFGQGHIPGAENMSANDLSLEDNIERLEDLKEKNYTVVLYGEDQLQANGPWMLFRQVGFNNIKVLVGGYQYYIENKDNLSASITDDQYQREIPRFDYAEMAAPKDGSLLNSTQNKKTVPVQRRQKSKVAAGGC
ncbi:MAG: rhodanese-like domain-containing protein [Draconibacterium sp.]